MNLLFAHNEPAATSWTDRIGTALQNPVLACIVVTLMAAAFLMGTLYVLNRYTSLSITNSKKRG